MAYDGVGNLISRTENDGAVEARTTQYKYDACGNQTKIIFPDAMKLSGNAWVSNGTPPEITVTYNALHQAVSQKDVRGNYSYKIYDQAGAGTLRHRCR
jgi:YD repeat-containing protein